MSTVTGADLDDACADIALAVRGATSCTCTGDRCSAAARAAAGLARGQRWELAGAVHEAGVEDVEANPLFASWVKLIAFASLAGATWRA